MYKMVIAAFALFCVPLLSAGEVLTEWGNFQSGVLEGINRLRGEAGAGPLILDERLGSMAGEWAATIAAADEMRHRGGLSELIQQNGYSYLNENLYFSQALPTPAGVLKAWKGSNGHLRNLLQSRIDRMGLGIGKSATGYYLVFNGATRTGPNP